MKTMMLIETRIVVYFLLILLIFWTIIIYKLKKQNIKLKIKNRRMKNIINIHYGRYGMFKIKYNRS